MWVPLPVCPSLPASQPTPFSLLPSLLENRERGRARACVKRERLCTVYVPRGAELRETLRIHMKHGFPGMLGGTDGVTTFVTGVPWTLKNKHKGKDGSVLTRAFNVSGSVRKRIFHVHGSHQGNDNDKTMAQYDTLMQGLRSGDIGGDETFVVYTSEIGDGAPEVQRGLWLLTDNANENKNKRPAVIQENFGLGCGTRTDAASLTQ